jgi:hypothetical protein
LPPGRIQRGRMITIRGCQAAGSGRHARLGSSSVK